MKFRFQAKLSDFRLKKILQFTWFCKDFSKDQFNFSMQVC